MNKSSTIQIDINTMPSQVLDSSIEENSKKVEAKIITGIYKDWWLFRIRLYLLGVIIKTYSNPLDWIAALKYLIQLRKKFLGNFKLKKMAKVDGKYYMGLYTPGWNDLVYKQFIVSQLNDFKKVELPVNRFNTVFVAITKKCALQCEHCYEWDNLNKKDILSSEKIIKIVAKLQNKGVSQIQFSGGEPLLKIDTLIDVLLHSKSSTNFWVATSGFKLTSDNAYVLKKSGLTGVIISLDHFMPEKHNKFRGFKDAYFWVEEAIKNAHNNNLVVALSVCVTSEFVSKSNLMSYMELAKKLSVSFVQFLEPKPVGHFANKNVLLKEDNIKILDDFFVNLNYDKSYESFPLITYHGYYQRQIGCFSAGIKGMYIDTDGDMNACPFCHKKSGNVLDDSFESQLELMSVQGCPTY